MGCGMCHAIAHGDFSYKDIKNIRKRLPTCARCRRSSESVTVVHGHRSAGEPVLSSEPGLAEDREVEKPCFMTIWYYVLEKNARGKRWITQYIVYFMDHTNSEDTIFAVNTEIQMMYTSRWVEKIR